MGFLSLVRKLKRKEREVRILILGLDNAGKTTVVKCLLGENTADVEPTLGFQIRTCQRQDLNLVLWDIGGQKSLRAYWRNYADETDALVYVLDVLDMERIQEARAELDEILRSRRMERASILLLLNKVDLAARPDELLQEIRGLFAHCSQLVFPCSAIQNVNVDRAFAALVGQVKGRLYADLPAVEAILR